MSHSWSLISSLFIVLPQKLAKDPCNQGLCQQNLAPRDGDLDLVITPRDLMHLLACCIKASVALRYGVFHGLSANRERPFDITEVRDRLGYRPRNDAYALARYHYPALLRRWAGRVCRLGGKWRGRNPNAH